MKFLYFGDRHYSASKVPPNRIDDFLEDKFFLYTEEDYSINAGILQSFCLSNHNITEVSQ